MDFLKTATKFVNSETHNLLATTRVIKNSIYQDNDLYLDSFKLGINKEVCDDFGVDYIKALNIESVDEKN